MCDYLGDVIIMIVIIEDQHQKNRYKYNHYSVNLIYKEKQMPLSQEVPKNLTAIILSY